LNNGQVPINLQQFKKEALNFTNHWQI